MWIGRGGAVAAVGFYMLVRGGRQRARRARCSASCSRPSRSTSVEALAVEVAALLLVRRRPLAFGAVAGLLVGTVGFATEFAWTQLVFPLPWTTDILVEGVALAVVGGVAGGLLGALLILGLRRRLPSRAWRRRLRASVLAISARTTACAPTCPAT